MTAALFTPPSWSKVLLSPTAAALLLALLVIVTPASGSSGGTITFTTPLPGATVTGNVPWLVEVSDQNPDTVDFYIDGILKWTEQRPPWQYHLDNTDGTLDTTKLSNGTHRLKVVANSSAGQTATAEILVDVTNGVPPTASTSTPSDGQRVSGTVQWEAVTTGVVKRVVFLVDGSQKWVENLAPYRFNSDGRFDTAALSDGTHELTVQAEGPGGSTSSSINVTVANKPAPTPTPPATPAPSPTPPPATPAPSPTPPPATPAPSPPATPPPTPPATPAPSPTPPPATPAPTPPAAPQKPRVRGITVSNATPADGATLAGVVTWDATTTGSVKRVSFLVDGARKWVENSVPYRFNSDGRFDTTKLSDGRHELAVRAEGSRGSASSSITVTVANTRAPASTGSTPGLTVSNATPADGATLAGVVTWDATTTGQVTRVVFLVDGTQSWVENLTPYRFNSDGRFDTTTLSDGRHQLTVRGEGPSGSTSSSITVNVANRVSDGDTAPVSTALPVISGTPLPGQTLSATAGTWTGTAPITFKRAWERCVGSTCTLIAGATSETYVVGSPDAGATIRHVVTATNGGGSATARSVDVTVGTAPAAAKPANTVLPTLSGSPLTGNALTATTGTWTGTAPIAYARSWERCLSGTCTPISGATSATYTLTSADVGATVRHVVTASNSAGTTIARSAQSSTIAASVGTETVPSNLGASLPPRMPESTGANFYVDGTNGSDSNPGSLSAPWRTINKALATVPLSGSIINVRGGTYVGMHQFVLRKGNPANPVTLQAYPGEHVLLTTPPNAQLHAVLVSKASGIRIRGFEITSPTAIDGVKVEDGTDVEIVDNEIHDTGRQGILVAGTTSSVPNNQNVQIWGNRFYDNGGGWDVGDHSVYYGAVVSNTDGIDHTTYGGVIANNLFYDQPYGFQLQIGSEADGLIVTNNTFYRATGPYPAGGSIVLYTETESPAYVTRNVLVVNNLITYAANVGVYGSGGGGLMETNRVRNNLAYGNSNGDFLSYYGSTSNTLFTLGPNFTDQDPRFVNAPGRDFRLQSASPAIGKADPAYAPPTDYDGRGRSGMPDLGALEY